MPITNQPAYRFDSLDQRQEESLMSEAKSLAQCRTGMHGSYLELAASLSTSNIAGTSEDGFIRE